MHTKQSPSCASFNKELNHFMRYRLTLLMTILLVSCGANKEDVPDEIMQRKNYWVKEVEFLNSNKISVLEAKSRYEKFKPMYDSEMNTLTFIDSFEADNLVCSEWHYIITIKSDAAGVVKDAELSEAGTCL